MDIALKRDGDGDQEGRQQKAVWLHSRSVVDQPLRLLDLAAGPTQVLDEIARADKPLSLCRTSGGPWTTR